MNVADQPAGLAHEMLVRRVDVWIVATGPSADGDFPDLAERDELAERLVMRLPG